MNNSVFIWMVIFAVSAISFFLIAAVVGIKGFFDLRLLLRHSNKNENSEPESKTSESDFSD